MIGICEKCSDDIDIVLNSGGGGTHLEKGYGDVQPLRPPFHALSAVP